MKLTRPLVALVGSIIRFVITLILVQFAFVASTHAQNAITLQGRVVYTTGDPAVGATVTMKKTISDGSQSTQTATAGGDGHYTFQSEAQCGVSYEFQAVSSEIVDDEPLPPSGVNGIG